MSNLPGAPDAITLAVLILNWQRPDMTSALLRDLSRELPTTGVEVLVLDNESTQEPPTWWSTVPGVSVYRSAQNLGYCGGMQLLMAKSSATAYWFLNNDCRLPDGMLSLVRDTAASGVAGIVLPYVVNPDGTVQSRDCHWSRAFGWRVGPAPRLAPNRYPIFGDIFVAPLISRATIQSLHLLPGPFHTYGEDFDACYAAAVAQVPVERYSLIQVAHAKSSSRPVSPESRYLFELQGVRNLLAAALVNYTFLTAVWALPLLILKFWLHHLVWRQRHVLYRSPRLWLSWLALPARAIRLRAQLGTERAARTTRRRLSDREVAQLR